MRSWGGFIIRYMRLSTIIMGRKMQTTICRYIRTDRRFYRGYKGFQGSGFWSLRALRSGSRIQDVRFSAEGL